MDGRLPLPALLSAAILLVPLQVDAAIVRLRRTVEVDSALIRLGDIAEVYAESESADETLRQVAIRPAPLAGTRIHLSAGEIREQLAARGVATGTLDFEGSATVLVTRRRQAPKPAEPKVIHAPPREAVRKESQPKPTRRRPVIPELAARDFNLAQQIVENVVQRHLDQAAPDWGKPRIQPLLTTADAPRLLKARSGSITIVQGQPLDEEHYLLTLAVPESDLRSDHVKVRVRILRRPKVFAPVRSVAKGEVLNRDDLVQIETDDEANGIADAQLIVGMEAVQPLHRGVPVRSSQLKPPLLVRRRETVEVIARSGLVRVRQFFVAKQDGRRGETILLEDLDGERTIPATVTGRLQAEVAGGTSGTPAQPSEPSAGVQITVVDQPGRRLK